MMVPKQQSRKKRKHHKNSILQRKDGRCYLCELLNNDRRTKQILHEHHIFGGPNRIHSEAEGLKVYLCLEHHTAGKEAVHNNAVNMEVLKREGQRAYEANHTREEFMRLFGKNYIDDELDADEEIEGNEAEYWFEFLEGAEI